MKDSEQLRSDLRSIDHRSYPAYKQLAGSYRFDRYVLNIEHVQGDPFAAPSNLSAVVALADARFPEEYRKTDRCRITLQDFLLRAFAQQCDAVSFKARGSGKSGLVAVTHPGQEVLERSACEVTDRSVIVRFEVGFPANGRTINARELEKILFELLPKAVHGSLFYAAVNRERLKQAIELCEDEEEIRAQLRERKLVAFLADGSILPRESGVSQKPMKGAVALRAPESLALTLNLPHRGAVRGLAIPQGITVIAGGGYHGKSTLLKALERGVYNHIAGDGRELVITDDTAWKLRAEDGRKITDVDISPFIRNLPGKTDTCHFSTLDASGSTSQAAGLIEAAEAGAKVLLIDEDTSATNLMVRDELMQQVISRDEEPIVPFLARARDLYEKAGISTILVVGSSGSYFHIADHVLQMDRYEVKDITERAKTTAAAWAREHADSGAPVTEAPDAFEMPAFRRALPVGAAEQKRRSYQGDRVITERLKIRMQGRSAFSIGHETLDLRYVEQLVDEEQTRMLSFLVRAAREELGGRQTVSSKDLFAWLEKKLRSGGFAAACGKERIVSGLAMVRMQEVCACFNRL